MPSRALPSLLSPSLPSPSRRRVLTGFAAAAGCLVAGLGRAGAAAFPGPLAETFAALEQQSGGRLGVALLDTRTGARAGHRADERFPMCSTVKLLVTGATLAKVDRGDDRLDRTIPVAESDLLAHAPVTRRHVGGDMTVEALCAAAMTVSDNTAANLLLDALGGPAGATAVVRSLGDTVTRLDRKEPALNEALPGDPRDTTTPKAMLADLDALALGNALAPPSREMLVGWMVANQTGGARLRAGVPDGWRVGDKTGAGGNGTSNDVAILWPPGRAPVLVAAFLTGSSAPPARRDEIIAAVGRAIAGLVRD